MTLNWIAERLRMGCRHTVASGLKYQAAAQAVKRFEPALAEGRDRKDFVARLKRHMSII
jgi:hypothetical protein